MRSEFKTTAFTLLTDIHPKALAIRIQTHRDSFEESISKQGFHLPSEAELDRWFWMPEGLESE